MMETSSNDADSFVTGGMNRHNNIELLADEEDGQNQHSLPSPEEAKTDSPPRSKDTHPLLILLIAVLFGVMIIGLSVGLTKDNRQDDKSSVPATVVPTGQTPAEKKDRSNNLKIWLMENVISEAATFDDATSPQTKALAFMADSDTMQLDIPLGSKTSPEGYTFLTRYVMALFYYSTGGPLWHYKLLFLSDNHVCDWFFLFPVPTGKVGVLCDEDNLEIEGISFINNNLAGTLPSELGLLTTITYLESFQNSIAGPIPDSYQFLTEIRTCNLSNNFLTGTLPSWLGTWAEMTFLFLSNNQFTGQLPDNFDQLVNLGTLGLGDNSLDGPIDKIWELSNLVWVYMDQNDFTGSFPTSIVAATPRLKNLDLSTNTINGTLPADLFRLSSLEILDLHDNAMTGSLPLDPVENANKMTFLTLHNNLFTNEIPTEFGLFKDLTHLDLSSNKLTGAIPTQLDKLIDLTYLFLAENPFTPGIIPTFIFAYDNLKELSLKNTRRTGPISAMIGSLQTLVLLDLDNNALTGNIPIDIGGLPDLQFLLLNRNQLDGDVPTELGDPPFLQFVLLGGNNVTGSLVSVCEGTNITLVSADCNEVDCLCCDPCCVDEEECHDLDLVSSVNPMWEDGYERQFYQFSNSSDQYEIIDDST